MIISVYIYQLIYKDWFFERSNCTSTSAAGDIARSILHYIWQCAYTLKVVGTTLFSFGVQWDNKKRKKRRIHDGMKDKTQWNMPSRRSVIDRMDNESNTCSLSFSFFIGIAIESLFLIWQKMIVYRRKCLSVMVLSKQYTLIFFMQGTHTDKDLPRISFFVSMMWELSIWKEKGKEW